MAPKPVAKINIEALLAKKDTIKAESIQNALRKHAEEQKKAAEEAVLGHIATIQEKTANAVNVLKAARNHEKRAKAYLTAVATAEQQFYTDADINAYNTAITAATRIYHYGK